MKYGHLYALFLALVFFNSCNGQSITHLQGPAGIARNIIQDRKGLFWIAAFDGVFRYDGKLSTNITRAVSSARLFCVIEDQKGNLWFVGMSKNNKPASA